TPHTLQILIKTFFFPALMCDKLTVVSGTEGQMFDFICEYPSDSKNNTKHFCCLDIDESFGQVVRTSKHNEWTREGRVSLYDNTTAGYFIVRLDKLYLNDSGKYHCGDFGSSDRIMKIHLHVSEGKVQSIESQQNIEPYIVQISVYKIPASTIPAPVHSEYWFLTSQYCLVILLMCFYILLCLIHYFCTFLYTSVGVLLF
uniref:Ig-like domain-containing protein n=1 Tax=Poecilia reticulata TaxID=8081 RepID=A0A3P9MT66_POERE